MFNYIDENINAIEKSNSVNCFATHKAEKGRSLYAHMVGGDCLQLTKPMSVFTYPFEPFFFISKDVLGESYFDDFAKITDFAAVNCNNFSHFSFKFEEGAKFKDIIVNFTDGTSCNLYSVKNKEFEGEKARLEKLTQQINEAKKIKQAENERIDSMVSDFEKMFLSMTKEEQDAFLRKFGYVVDETAAAQNESEKTLGE